uniref:Immunoglobulin V-set domain-containing protein n=1 Tax=Sarcophilus harrisii TaxID=9305 RepID=A0A7N4NFU3_SARHA
MVSPVKFFCLFLLGLPDADGQIMMTQSPTLLSVSPGDTFTISCRASQNINKNLDWFQQKHGQSPKLLIYNTNNLHSGIPSWFSGTLSPSAVWRLKMLEFITVCSTVISLPQCSNPEQKPHQTVQLLQQRETVA